jgi:hypothetical protein
LVEPQHRIGARREVANREHLVVGLALLHQSRRGAPDHGNKESALGLAVSAAPVGKGAQQPVPGAGMTRLRREARRLETYVCARADGGAGPLGLKLRESTRLFGQFS